MRDAAWIDEVLRRTSRHELVARRLDVTSGTCGIESASRGTQFAFDGTEMVAVFGPRWRLVIVGAGQLSRTVAEIARALDFEIICCDPRIEVGATWDVPHTTFTTLMPDDVIVGLELDANSAVVALTHDPTLDDLALLEALKSPAFYVGALGSRRNTLKRKERLTMFDRSPDEIGRLHGPIGLHLGCVTPAEIAVSIAAELVAVKNGIELKQKKSQLPDCFGAALQGS